MPKKIDPTKADWGESLALSVGRNIRIARTKAKLSAQELSKQLEENYGISLSRSVIANIESGRRTGMTVQEVHAIAKILDVPLSQLLEEDLTGFEIDQMNNRGTELRKDCQKLVDNLTDFMSNSHVLAWEIDHYKKQGISKELSGKKKGDFLLLEYGVLDFLQEYKDGKKILEESYQQFLNWSGDFYLAEENTNAQGD